MEYSNISGNADSEAFGVGADATGQYSTAIGKGAQATVQNATAIGWGATATTTSANTAVGRGAAATGNNSIAIGSNSVANAESALAFGTGSVASATNAVAIGVTSQATGLYSLALGRGVNVGHEGSIALGTNLSTTAVNQFLVGSALNDIRDMYVGKGITHATPQSLTINATGGSGTNIAGASLTIAGGKGTGSGTPGVLVFSTSTAAASSSTLQTLTERMRIDGSGNVGIGTAAPTAGTKLEVAGNISMKAGADAYLQTTDSNNLILRADQQSGANGKGVKIQYWNGGSWNDAISIANAPAAGGSYGNLLLLQAGGNVGIGTTTFGTSAAKVLAIGNGTAPTTSIADGIQLWAEDVTASSELRVRDEAGNITTLSPHNFSLFNPKEDYYLPWAYTSERDRQAINVDMYGAIQQVELLSGKHFIYGKNLQTNEEFHPTKLSDTGILASLEARILKLESPTPTPADAVAPPQAGGETDDTPTIQTIQLTQEEFTTLLTATLKTTTALHIYQDIIIDGNARVAGTLTRGNEKVGVVVIPAHARTVRVYFPQAFPTEMGDVDVTLSAKNTFSKVAPFAISNASFEIRVAEDVAEPITVRWNALALPSSSTTSFDVLDHFEAPNQSSNEHGSGFSPQNAAGQGEEESIEPEPIQEVPVEVPPVIEEEVPSDTEI